MRLFNILRVVSVVCCLGALIFVKLYVGDQIMVISIFTLPRLAVAELCRCSFCFSVFHLFVLSVSRITHACSNERPPNMVGMGKV